jgi:N-acetylneuraminic acid mutarotase
MYEKYMYIFGGCGKHEKNTKLWEAVYRLDLESNEWEKYSP